MGQAKLRGTFEQRKVEGEAKRKAEAEQRAEQRRLERVLQLEREANMSPEEKAALDRSREVLAAVATIAAASDLRGTKFAKLTRHFNSG